MRAAWTVGGFVGLGCLIALGCDSSEPGKGQPSSSSRAIRALIENMHFDGGVTYLEPIPPASDEAVQLLSDSFDPLLPGTADLLPFVEDNPHDDDASEFVLLSFGDEDGHVEVPVSKSVSHEPGELSFSYELDEAVCEELCNRRYTIALTAAIKLESDGIGKHLESEVVLDCRTRGSAEQCVDGERSRCGRFRVRASRMARR